MWVSGSIPPDRNRSRQLSQVCVITRRPGRNAVRLQDRPLGSPTAWANRCSMKSDRKPGTSSRSVRAIARNPCIVIRSFGMSNARNALQGCHLRRQQAPTATSTTAVLGVVTVHRPMEPVEIAASARLFVDVALPSRPSVAVAAAPSRRPEALEAGAREWLKVRRATADEGPSACRAFSLIDSHEGMSASRSWCSAPRQAPSSRRLLLSAHPTCRNLGWYATSFTAGPVSVRCFSNNLGARWSVGPHASGPEVSAVVSVLTGRCNRS